MNDNDQTIDQLILTIAKQLGDQNQKLVTAESCTGGWVSQKITDLPGSSKWFERGYVTYSKEAKQECLDVPNTLIAKEGEVSEACALAMAEGALLHSHADYALSITGIAGPDGGSEQKPVGLVCFGFSGKNVVSISETQNFSGNRKEIRYQSVQHALQQLLLFIRNEAK